MLFVQDDVLIVQDDVLFVQDDVLFVQDDVLIVQVKVDALSFNVLLGASLILADHYASRIVEE